MTTRGVRVARAAREAHENRPRLTYRPELDGLRGIAILAVLAYHYEAPFGQNGFLGVDLFFVLSGFLITSILATELQRTGSIDYRAFYVRRAKRLFPALWLMLLAVAAFVPASYIVSTLLYVNILAVGLGALPIDSRLGHVWSLAIEEQYYLFWPAALVFLLRRFPPRSVALFILGLAVASALWRAYLMANGASDARIYYGTDAHADGILAGSALGIAAGYRLLPAMGPRILFGLLPLLILLVVTLPDRAHVILAHPAMVLVGIAIILSPGWLRRVLSIRPLVAIGKISYGLYLWNVPIVHLELQPAWLMLVLTVVVAGLSYRYIEQPILRSRWPSITRPVPAT